VVRRKPLTPDKKTRTSYKQTRRLPAVLAAVCVYLIAFAFGCRKSDRPLTPDQIHAITRELATAASTIKHAEIHTELASSDESPKFHDRLNITLTDSSARAQVSGLLQSLGRVATRHRLTQDAQSETRGAISYNYSRAGDVTHSIHIRLAPSAPAGTTGKQSQQASPGHPRLAIILDDLGVDRAPADAIFALPFPITISVLPNRPHSVDIAEAARSRGFEVMLHLPMESVGNGTPESRELRPGMSEKDVAALVNQFVSAVPGVAGVNNHQGSQSTADPALMNELMRVLRDRNLFYIDSRTTPATVAYDAARQAGVRSAFRNVPFIDDIEKKAAIEKQLRVALRGAKTKGEAIAIGHPHSATLQALKEILPQAKAEGIQLVFASDLVH
jgi:uncharacterized protein